MARLRRFTDSPEHAGVASSFIKGFREYLVRRGHTPTPAAVGDLVRSAGHLGLWMQHRGLAIGGLSEAVVRSFVAHLRSAGCRSCRHRARISRTQTDSAGARRFLVYLRSEGIVRSVPPAPCRLGGQPVLDGFRRWMLCHRGVKLRTVDTHYRRILEDLFKEVGSDPSRYDAACLRRFVLKQGRRYSTTWTQNVASAVRVFVRFLIATGRCPPSLAGAIPSIASWRLSALPRYLPPTEVNLLLRSCLPNSRTGLRDRAVLLLLSRLGLRAKDIVDLRVDDIDWTEGSLSVEGKTRRRDRLPLPQDVGDAILAYLERGRPFVDCEDHLFLTAKAPWTRLGPSNTVSSVVRRAIRRAGIKAPSSGAHMLRHSAATQMLRKGSSLQAIAWVLRHRSLETTAIYAKVDTGALKRIAQPWPEATSC